MLRSTVINCSISRSNSVVWKYVVQRTDRTLGTVSPLSPPLPSLRKAEAFLSQYRKVTNSVDDTVILRMRETYHVYGHYTQQGGATMKIYLDEFPTLQSAEKFQSSWEAKSIAKARRAKDRWALKSGGDENTSIMFSIESVLCP
eukprot:PhF_6_TR13230/c0_g1_i4/m.20930